MAGFIENVNNLAAKIQVMSTAVELFDDDVIPVLKEIADLDLQEAIDDLRKGNYLGNRKIDINLALNMIGVDESTEPDVIEAIWTDPTKIVLYESTTVTFVDGVVVTIPFMFDGYPTTVSTHGDLLIQLNNSTTFLDKLNNTLVAGFATPIVGEIVRFFDIIGSNSNVERIVLHAVSGTYKEANPVYYWGKTTSAFQTLSMRAGDIIKIGNEIDNLIKLATSISQLLELELRIPELVDTYIDGVPQNTVTVYNKLQEILEVYSALTAVINVSDSIQNVNSVNNKLDDIENVTIHIIPNLPIILGAYNNATISTAQAQIATDQATIATTRANEIKNVSVGSTVTAIPGTNASVTYSPISGKFAFIIPQGVKGDKGDAFQVNAVGLLIDMPLYAAQTKSFSFLAIDESKIYFKLSNTVGDWSVGAPFGKGDTGTSIGSIDFESSTDVSNLPAQVGAIDTYKVNFTDGSFATFTVANGTDQDGNTIQTLYEAQTDKVLEDINKLSFSLDTTLEATKGEFTWNPVAGTLDLGLENATLQVGQENFIRVYASSGLLNGQVAMAAGTVANTGRIKVLPHTGIIGTGSQVLGIATHDISSFSEGFITTEGKVRDINTTGSISGEIWEDGDILYIKPNDAGRLTKVEPLDNEIKLPIAYVINAHATKGALYIRVNGIDLNEYKRWTKANVVLKSEVNSITNKSKSNAIAMAIVFN